MESPQHPLFPTPASHNEPHQSELPYSAGAPHSCEVRPASREARADAGPRCRPSAPPESLTGAHPALEAAIVMVSVIAFGLAVATLDWIGSAAPGDAVAAGEVIAALTPS